MQEHPLLVSKVQSNTKWFLYHQTNIKYNTWYHEGW